MSRDMNFCSVIRNFVFKHSTVMQLAFWYLYLVSIMLTCLFCSRTDFTDQRGLSNHLKTCKKRVQIKAKQPKSTAKRQKTHHTHESAIPGDGDYIGSNANSSTPVPEILEFVSFYLSIIY